MAFWPRLYREAVMSPLTLGGVPIQFVYLGHVVNTNLKDDADIYKQVKKLNTIGNVMIRKFDSCSLNVKCKLFRAHCSALYCAPLWCSYNLIMYRKLKVSHNDILRRLMGVPRYYSARTMFVNSYQDNIDVLIRKQCNGFKNRLQCSDNRIISAIVNSYPFKMSKLYARWRMNTEIVRI